jgi:Ca2+-binding RTX toxin-like protein
MVSGRIAVLAVLAMLALPCAAASAATLKADYRFQSSLASTVPGAPALQNLGPGTNAFATENYKGARTVLTFPAGNGVRLTPTTGLISSTQFSVVILARLQGITTSTRFRYLDVKNGTADSGLYAFGQQLWFWTIATSSQNLLQPGIYAQIVYVRDASQVMRGYVNGTLVFTASDTPGTGAIDAAATVRFFRDNEVNGTGDHTAGGVARIRVYDGALTTAEVAALDDVPADDPCSEPGAIVGTAANETLNGTASPDAICGMGGNDKINGLGGNDRLLGGVGNDTIDGGTGADRMQGEAGTDVVTYAGRGPTQGVAVDLDDDSISDGEPGEGDDVRDDVENLTGGAGVDTLHGSTIAANTLTGGAGVDNLDGRAGNDKLDGGADGDSLIGGTGNDTLNSGGADDHLSGDGGNDTMDGGTGADQMFGGLGTDTVTYASRTALQPVNVTIGTIPSTLRNDGQQNEQDDVQADVENVTGGAGNDLLVGVNAIPGGLAPVSGNNALVGGAGRDELYGLGANDTLDGGLDADLHDGGAGTDVVTYAKRKATEPVVAWLDGTPNSGGVVDGPVGARDTLLSTVESLTGGAGDDSLTGSALGNTLNGGKGADTLIGLDGNDTLSARDLLADTLLNCDGGAAPGTKDKATLDLADPDAPGCETASRL